MTAVYRVDYSGKLGKLQKTPQGGYRIPATIARVGILEYGDGRGGVVREYNPPEVLQAALDSLADGPVTNEHPADEVTPANYRNHSAGHVSGTPTFKDGMLHATLAIQDAALIADIELGTRREVSAGYRAHVDHTPGVTPEGEAYDAIRTRIDFNHVAVVSEGRAGPQVRLVIDSASGNVRDEMQDGSANATLVEPMSIFKIDGKDVPAAEAQTRFDAYTGKRDAEAQTLQTKLDAAVADTAAEKTKREKAEADLAAEKDPKKLDAAVTARMALLESATKICGKAFKADGLTSDLAIVTAVVKQAYPKLDLKEKSEAYIQARFDGALEAVEADPDGLKILTGERPDLSAPPAPPVAKPETKSDARAEMLKHNQSLGNRNTNG